MLLNGPYSLHYAPVCPWSRNPDGIHQIIHDCPNLRRIAALDGLQKLAFFGHIKRCWLGLLLPGNSPFSPPIQKRGHALCMAAHTPYTFTIFSSSSGGLSPEIFSPAIICCKSSSFHAARSASITASLSMLKPRSAIFCSASSHLSSPQ